MISSQFPKLINNQSLSDFIESAFDTAKADPLTSLPMRIAVSKAMISTQVRSKHDALSLILDSKLAGRDVTIESCRDAMQFVESVEPATNEQLRMLVVAKFPFAKDL